MPKSSSVKQTLLVLTSTFPRWEHDNEPAFVLELCRRLNDRYRILVLAPGAPGARDHEQMDGLSVFRYKYFPENFQSLAYNGGVLSNLRKNPLRYFIVPFFVLAQVRALIGLLKKEDVALIHAHWIIPQGLVVFLAGLIYRIKIPVICTSHGADLFALNGFPLSFLKRRILKNCRFITVVSNVMKERLVGMGIEKDRVSVISMGVDLSAVFTPAYVEERSKNEILFVGRLVEKKGVINLLYAIRQVIALHKEVTLIIVGGGPQEELLREMTDQLEIGDRVAITGPLNSAAIARHYRRAAMAVFPFVVARDGDQEGLGLVMIEALGCECPVVVSDLEAVRDVIVHERNGLLTRPGDPDDIAAAILRLLREPDMAASLARTGRMDVLPRFNWDSVAGRYAELIDGVIG